MSFSLAEVRGVVLDVDGVLLDARPSYHAVAEEAARRAIAPLVGEAAARAAPFDREREVAAFKAAGGFNDDWEMSRAIALLLFLRASGEAPELGEFLAGAGGRGVEGLFSRHPRMPISQAQVARICGALYGGSRCRELFGFDAREAVPDAPERGWWENEQVLPDPALLEAVAARFPLALYTGRNPGETSLAQHLCKLKIPPGLCWVADGKRPRKPDPAGLLWLTHALLRGAPRGAQALFVGDTADDQAASRAAQDAGAPIVYAHVEAAGDTTRVLSRLLADTGKAEA
ncbi:MAG TPA: HAD family hydrolase [Myxococcales bacterium]|jgi:HAD superfamily phosphatase|nr:HAD family hydrolase [Myxococcales bacterium]